MPSRSPRAGPTRRWIRSRAAGVAVGTLYRHYPTKTDLVRAVLDEASNRLVLRVEEAARSLRRPGDAVASIERLLADYLAEAATNQSIKAAAGTLGAADGPAFAQDPGRVALSVLLQAAQADGDIRPEITPDDAYLILATAPASLNEASRERWMEIVLGGIRAR
ncbi:TetR family transcriptional regulator [Actinoplanes sp. HUAS TT8]|uniref:SbtR family transcriptional regulator n=1 Tax=Actinoplanes sp. HUAS TT8 TaxID=3447453 RepID=UPI003F51BE21